MMSAGARQILKLAFVSLFYYSGLLWLYAGFSLRRRAVVLTYHRVLPKDRQSNSFSNPSIVVTPTTFERHMRFLRRFMNPISLDELTTLLRDRRPIPPRTCLVTFDDGWYDNFEFALPILRRYRVPAALFIATNYVDSEDCFWQERLSRLLFRVWQQRGISSSFIDDLGLASLNVPQERNAVTAIAKVIHSLKKARSPHGIARFTARVAAALAAAGIPLRSDVHEDRFLGWSQLSAMRDSGIVTIGSHAMSHTPLDQLDATELARELLASRRTIRERLGCDAATFAYPNGDFDEATVEAVRAAAYELAFTTQRGTVSLESDPMRLKRVNVHESAAPTAAALFGRMAAS